MRVENIYIADDGRRFTSERACVEYEQEQVNSLSMLENCIIFYDSKGNRVPYTRIMVNTCAAQFANVLYIPAWDSTDKTSQAWGRVVPDELDNEARGYGEGWYIFDGEYKWYSWNEFDKEYTYRNRIINEILCEGK